MYERRLYLDIILGRSTHPYSSDSCMRCPEPSEAAQDFTRMSNSPGNLNEIDHCQKHRVDESMHPFECHILKTRHHLGAVKSLIGMGGNSKMLDGTTPVDSSNFKEGLLSPREVYRKRYNIYKIMSQQRHAIQIGFFKEKKRVRHYCDFLNNFIKFTVIVALRVMRILRHQRDSGDISIEVTLNVIFI